MYFADTIGFETHIIQTARGPLTVTKLLLLQLGRKGCNPYHNIVERPCISKATNNLIAELVTLMSHINMHSMCMAEKPYLNIATSNTAY